MNGGMPGGVEYGDSIPAIVNCIVSIPNSIPTHTHTHCKFKSVILFITLCSASTLLPLATSSCSPAPVNPCYSLTLNSDILSIKQPHLNASLLGSSPLQASSNTFHTALLMFLFITIQITRAKIISLSFSSLWLDECNYFKFFITWPPKVTTQVAEVILQKYIKLSENPYYSFIFYSQHRWFNPNPKILIYARFFQGFFKHKSLLGFCHA